MTKKYISFFVQILLAFILYYVFVEYLEVKWIFVGVIIVAAVLFAVFNVRNTKNGEIFLEVNCDPERYLAFAEEKYQDTPDKYHLAKAYAYIHQGKYDEAQSEFIQVDYESIKKSSKLDPIYIRINTVLAYQNKEDQKLNEIFQTYSAREDADIVLKDYIRVYLLMLREEYEYAIDLLMDAIPEQYNRVQVVELNYYLGWCYYKFDEKDRALEVVGFMIKKNHPLIYTKLSHDLYELVK